MMEPFGHARDGERYTTRFLDVGGYIFHLQIYVGLEMIGCGFDLVCR
jgi:hypothetical protein